MQKVNGASKVEKAIMSLWLKENRIAFEFINLNVHESVEIRLVDYNHNCEIASKKYPIMPPISREAIQKLIMRFEEEEVFPILFEGYRSIDLSRLPDIRLIRED